MEEAQVKTESSIKKKIIGAITVPRGQLIKKKGGGTVKVYTDKEVQAMMSECWRRAIVMASNKARLTVYWNSGGIEEGSNAVWINNCRIAVNKPSILELNQ